MIIFVDEMTPDQLRIATISLFEPGTWGGKSDSYISDKSYTLFKNKFPNMSVGSGVHTRGWRGRVTLSGETLWFASTADPSLDLAYMRAQLQGLMPEGFDFPDEG